MTDPATPASNGGVAELAEALLNLRAHAERTHEIFAERMGERDRPTWFAVNALQEFVDFVRLWNIYDRLSALKREAPDA